MASRPRTRPVFDPSRSIELHRKWLRGREVELRSIEDRWELVRVAAAHQDPLVRAVAITLGRMMVVNLDGDSTAKGKALRAIRDRAVAVRGQLAEASRLAGALRGFLAQTRTVGADIEALRRVTLPMIISGCGIDPPQPRGDVTSENWDPWDLGWDSVESAALFLEQVGAVPIESMGLPTQEGREEALKRAVLRDLEAGGWDMSDVSRELIDDCYRDEPKNRPADQLDRLRKLWPAPAGTDPEQLYRDGHAALAETRYGDAITAWRRCTELLQRRAIANGEKRNPALVAVTRKLLPALHYNLGEAYRLAGDFSHAREQYAQFVQAARPSSKRTIAERYLVQLTPDSSRRRRAPAKPRRRPNRTASGRRRRTRQKPIL